MGEWKFTIQGETPAKKNSRIWNKARNVLLPGKRFSSWHDSAMVQLLKMPRPMSALHGPVSVSVRFTHGDIVRRDGDNGLSSVMDLLVDMKILEDDKWIIVRRLSVENCYEKGAARCEITVLELPADIKSV